MYGPDVAILLMYGSHDMKHTGFHWLTVINGTSGNGASHRRFFFLRAQDKLKPKFFYFNSEMAIRVVRPTSGRSKFSLVFRVNKLTVQLGFNSRWTGLPLELAIGRAGPGRAKTGPGQNWPGFFGPEF